MSEAVKSGGEILVNTTTPGDQAEPAIVGLADGGLVVTWTDTSQSARCTADSIDMQGGIAYTAPDLRYRPGGPGVGMTVANATSGRAGSRRQDRVLPDACRSI